MNRLIDADALIEDCKKYLNTLNPDRDGKECTRIHWLIGVLSNAPTIEERKKGKWTKISPANIYECSVCGQNVMTQDIEAYHFCHGCGADMREGQE